jgi:hypothetical protein
MRPCAAAPLTFVTDGCPAGRGPVRVPMAALLPRRSGLAGTPPHKDADTGYPGSGNGHPEVGWHPQQASMPSVGDSNSQ